MMNMGGLWASQIINRNKMENKNEEGLRYNEGKLRYDLQHPVATQGLVKVLTKGALKYDVRNWEKGMKWSNVISSLKRHLAAIELGEDYDEETGELHIDHLQCNAHFLSAYYKIYPQGDDRPHNYLKNRKIGLDIDEVLCDWVTDWRNVWEIDKIPKSWYFDRDLGNRLKEMKDAGVLERFYLNLMPLIKPEDIPFEPHCYITSRPVDVSLTEAWLSNHGFPAVPVYNTDSKNTKAVIAKREGLNIFVDDRFENFVEINKVGVNCYLMDAPHNRKHDVGFKRITNLNQI